VNEHTRVLLIDDHEMARRGLRAMLSAADWIEVAGEGDSCESGLKLAEELQPDMVLLDIRMPGLDGLACLERLKARHPQIAVIIVTLYDDRRYVLEAIRRGAAGYLLKDASTAEVIQTLHNVANGQLAVVGVHWTNSGSTPYDGATCSDTGSLTTKAPAGIFTEPEPLNVTMRSVPGRIAAPAPPVPAPPAPPAPATPWRNSER